MSYQFETYKSRKIEFQQLKKIDEWSVKVYSITINLEFQSQEILKNAIHKLPTWLILANISKLPTYKIAFLIVHEAREGVWILLNWWTGGEMIESKVYFTDYDHSNTFKPSLYNTNSLLCVWELEIFTHECKAWTEHVLLQADNPKFEDYSNDIYAIKIK